MKTDKKSNKKSIIIIISAAVLVIAAAVTIMAVCGVFSPPAPKEEAKGVVGVITDNWDPNVEPDPSAKQKSGTRIPGYSSAEMKSPLLSPGQGLTEVPLNKTLEKGTYNAKVVYRCVLLDEKNTPLNAAESGFQLIVK